MPARPRGNWFSCTLIFALFQGILFTSVAKAEINVLMSLERLVCKAEIIVLGKIKTTKETKGPHQVLYKDCVFAVDELLKGKVEGDELAFVHRRLSPQASMLAPIDTRHQMLLFLSASKDHGPEPHLDDQWVPTPLEGQGAAIIDLANLPKHLYSRGIQRITKPEEVVKLTREWANSSVAHSLYLDVPFGSPIFEGNYWGSSVLIVVPAEEKYREKYLKLAQSEVPHERAQGAAHLYKSPGEETEKLLWKLTSDKTENYSQYAADIIAHIHFPVREAAFHSLQQLHDSPDLIRLQREPTSEEQRKFRHAYWMKAFEELLPEGWRVFSIQDGDAMPGERWQLNEVVICCARGKAERPMFRLIPKGWPQDKLPEEGLIGIYAPESQAGRYFYEEQATPGDLRKAIEMYFELEQE